jgi:hypothetical protein
MGFSGMDAQKIPSTENGASAPRKNLLRRSWDFAREIWNDHEFWIKVLAIKGGASAAVIAGVVGISYVLPLPFIIAAAGISACTGLIGLGLYGVFLGAAGARDKLADIYSKTISHKPRKQKAPSLKRLHRKLLDSPRVKKWMAKPLTQKFLNSRPWKFTLALAQKEQNVFMAALAGTGSVFWGTVSAIALAAVLPALAIGSVFTFGTALAIGGTISGAYGVYLSVQSMVHSIRAKKGAKNIKDGGQNKPAAESPVASQQRLPETKLTPDFTQSAQKTEKTEKQPAASPESPPPPTP